MSNPTYQPTAADRATVRTLTGLDVGELTDGNLDALLVLDRGAVRLASADALETVAGTLATISAESDDISIDGSKRASILMARAAALRVQHAAEISQASGGPVGVRMTGFDPFNRRVRYPVWIANLPEPRD